MHNAMPDADQTMRREPIPQRSNEIVERAVVAQPDALAPRFFAQQLSGRRLGDETGRGVQTLRLSARDQLESNAVLGARVPIILTSRADSVTTRLASCAVAALVANARREKAGKAVA